MSKRNGTVMEPERKLRRQTNAHSHFKAYHIKFVGGRAKLTHTGSADADENIVLDADEDCVVRFDQKGVFDCAQEVSLTKQEPITLRHIQGDTAIRLLGPVPLDGPRIPTSG